MAHSNSFEEALAQLKLEFLESSEDRIDEVDNMLGELMDGKGDTQENLLCLQRHIHSIKGSGGTYGFSAITLIAHALEDYIELSDDLDKNAYTDIQAYVDQIRKLLERGDDPSDKQTSEILKSLPVSNAKVSPSSTISDQTTKDISALLVMPTGVQRTIITKELMSCGFRVISAASGVEGIKLALKTRPDMVVSSMVLSDMSGVELSNALGAISVSKEKPFILMTSKRSDEELSKDLPAKARIVQKDKDFAAELASHMIDWGLFGEVSA